MRFFIRRTAGSLRTSAPIVEASGPLVDSATVWAGASATLADICADLDDELGNISAADLVVDGDAESKKRARFARLKQRAETFANSDFPDGKFPAWNCSDNTAQLVHVAAICSKAVYETKKTVEIERCSTTLSYSIQRSQTKASKQTAIYSVVRRGTNGQNATTIIASPRGSRGHLDWAVNMNTQLVDAAGIIGMDSLEKAGEAIGMRPGVVHTHNGFCKAASALIPKLSEKLRRLLNNVSQGTVDVVFTGHSAGGATAMLLFTHFLTKAADYSDVLSPRVRVSCITFGAPPVFGCNITPLLQKLQSVQKEFVSVGKLLAFAIDGDPIPRIDSGYAKELIKIYFKAATDEDEAAPVVTSNLSYSLPALSNGNNDDDDDDNNTLIPPESDSNATQKPSLDLPKLSLYRAGELVMLVDENRHREGNPAIAAYLLQEEDMNNLLFGNAFVHKMDEYKRWIKKLSCGNFNGRPEWTDLNADNIGVEIVDTV